MQVIRLELLSPEKMPELCEKLAEMHSSLYSYERALETEELARFIQMGYNKGRCRPEHHPQRGDQGFDRVSCQNLAVATDELLQGDFLLPDPSLPTPVICSMMNVGYNNVPASGVESEIGPSMF